MIDTHSHLNFKDFNSDYSRVIAEAEKNGIKALVNVGAQFETSEKAMMIAQNHQICFASVGIHPVHTQDVAALREAEIIARLEKLAQNKKVVAIGETGLDYYHLPKSENEKIKASQKALFQIQIKLARELNLPLILHCRDAYRDLISIIKETTKQWNNEAMRGVVHCFCGDSATAQKFLTLGFYIGFTGLITYPGNEYLGAVTRAVPQDKILAETDCPYLPPQAKRGERNLPYYVRYVIEYMAQARGVDYKEMERLTNENAKKLFRLN